MDMNVRDFVIDLASKAPVPGGGGASALAGAVGAALSAMVANLTSGKKKYAAYQSEIEGLLEQARDAMEVYLRLMERDAEAFTPLAQAYGVPKEEPGRTAVLEQALLGACQAPLAMLREAESVLDILERLAVIGSQLAVSDVGVAAAALRCAIEGAALNVYCNTKLLQDRAGAARLNAQAEQWVREAVARCEAVYRSVIERLR